MAASPGSSPRKTRRRKSSSPPPPMRLPFSPKRVESAHANPDERYRAGFGHFAHGCVQGVAQSQGYQRRDQGTGAQARRGTELPHGLGGPQHGDGPHFSGRAGGARSDAVLL